MQNNKVIWLLYTWLCLGKIKSVYNINNKVFLCATLFILLVLLCDAQQTRYCTWVQIFIYNTVQRTDSSS